MHGVKRMVETIEEEVLFTSSSIGKKKLDSRVMKAMLEVPRHKFVPAYHRDYSYADTPLPIGYGQTISQPYIVALMSDLLNPKPDHVILEVGTGCGYQTAVLSKLVKKVYSIEVIPGLAEKAAKRLDKLGYKNVEVQCADGYFGWPEHAPFDGIIVTAAATHLPQPLVEQLKVGGSMVIPIGMPGMHQELMVAKKHENGKTSIKDILGVSFVPLTGAHEFRIHADSGE